VPGAEARSRDLASGQERIGGGFPSGSFRGVAHAPPAQGICASTQDADVESMSSLARHSERNIKRFRGTKMLQRWLGSVLLYCEGHFNKVKGIWALRDNLWVVASL
jgi:hypothetical protein